MTDLIIRLVEGYGYLPIIEKDGIETYRGEYQETSGEALAKCEARLCSETD